MYELIDEILMTGVVVLLFIVSSILERILKALNEIIKDEKDRKRLEKYRNGNYNL